MQLIENVVALCKVEVCVLPEVVTGPLHPPEAVHDVAFVELQVSVDTPPGATVAGDALTLTVGAADGGGGGGVLAATVTVAVRETLPPAPVHCRL